MDSVKFLLFAFVFVAGLVNSNVHCALRSKMNGMIGDASDVTWAHAVNSRRALRDALTSPVDFLEADVTLGQRKGDEEKAPIPVMAHPPEYRSDITLDDWLYTIVNNKSDKGIKLDFKYISTLEPSFHILQRYSSKLSSLLWLNADVLTGPISSATTPLPAEKFLALCHEFFPEATLSLGWTTHFTPLHPKELWRYEWQHVREMADLLRCRGYESNNHPRFTFPVRGVFATRSVMQLQWLLGVIPNSTLTVWTTSLDDLQVDDLLRIRTHFPKDNVYYDLPHDLNDDFQKKKATVSVLPAQDPTSGNGQWLTFTRRGQSESCSALTYTRSDSIVFGRSLTTAVLHKKTISLVDGKSLRVTGRIKFFNTKEGRTASSGEGSQELTIFLADVSLFSKTSGNWREKLDLTSSDTDVIWSAIDESAIYTIRHEYDERDTACRLFELDTSQERSFQAWTMQTCDEEGEILEHEAAAHGTPDVSSRKRLVLPKGPFMLGFMSAGDQHVAIYDLEMDIPTVEGHTSGSKSHLVTGSGLLCVALKALCLLL